MSGAVSGYYGDELHPAVPHPDLPALWVSIPRHSCKADTQAIAAVGVFTQHPGSQVPLCASHIPESQKDPGVASDIVSTPAPRSRAWEGPLSRRKLREVSGGAPVALGSPSCYFWVFLPRGWGAGRLLSISLGKMHQSLSSLFSFFKTIFHLNNRVGWDYFGRPQGMGES